MVHLLLIFFITSFISFFGSLQLGPVNLAIMKVVLEGRKKAGLLIGFGVCIPEFIYAAFAIFAAAWLVQRQEILAILEWSIVPVMLTLGLINFFKKKKAEEIADKGGRADFLRGVVLSLLNPQLLPFWLAILVMLNGYNFFSIHTFADRMAFVIGTGAGEFGLVALVVWQTARHREYLLEKIKKWNLNRVFGSLYIGLAVVQAVKLIIHLMK
ncbi:MAG: LysE family translocator [Bacteroidota bacterium]|nr:LysE family translocator [Bacteroidota bacterium]